MQKRIAKKVRRDSQTNNQQRAVEIMDVTQSAVESMMREHQVDLMIHGHTHRPAIHEFIVDGKPMTRVVLPAWDHAPGVLTLCSDGMFGLGKVA